MGEVQAVQQHDIEAAGVPGPYLASMTEKPFGGANQLGLLGRGDARRGAAETRIGAHADLDEDQHFAVGGDEIDFSEFAAYIAGNDLEPLPGQPGLGQAFGQRAVPQVRRDLRHIGLSLRMPAPKHLRDAFMDSSDQSHAQPPAGRILHPGPALYVVATPLGNLYDITMRALAVLGKVDAIAAEDTRHTRRLLDHHGIRTRLLAVHQHNEQAAADGLVALLAQGQHIALVTDAGTPAVSDPGARVVARVQQAGYPVIPLPGPSAVTTALSASGLVEGRFLFVGFLPPKSAARRTELEALAATPAALVFYEAPHRVVECVADLAAVLGAQRELVVARELTKLHEQIARMPLAEAGDWFAADADRCRGEFVLIVSPPPLAEGLSADAERTLRLLLPEVPLKTAARLAAELTGANKNALYQRALQLKDGA